MFIIPSYHSAFAELFINLALLLREYNHHVLFVNPDKYNKILIKKYKLQIGYGNIKGTYLCWNNGNYQDAWYFENGYFNKTLQCNRKGINCKAEFVGLSYNGFMKFSYKKIHLPDVDFEPIKIKHNILKRLFLRLLDGRTDFTEAFKQFRIKPKLVKDNRQLPDEYVFFPLQVSNDTQIQENSPLSSMTDALDSILPFINYKVVLKQHPAERENINYSKYKSADVFFSNNDINDLIDNSEYVTTINSSVGLQALERGKGVITYGNAMYKNYPKKEYVNHFRELFINGDWRNPDYEFLKQIIERICAN